MSTTITQHNNTQGKPQRNPRVVSRVFTRGNSQIRKQPSNKHIVSPNNQAKLVYRQKPKYTRPINQNSKVPKQSNNRPKSQKPTPKAAPNYVTKTKENGETKRYAIGPEHDARNHLGWRKVHKIGSSAQFMFIPAMVNRVDQCYIKTLQEESNHIDTFAIGIYVQDSKLAHNVMRKPASFPAAYKEQYVQQLKHLLNVYIERVEKALQTSDPSATSDYIVHLNN